MQIKLLLLFLVSILTSSHSIADQKNALQLINQTRAPAKYPCAECHGLKGNPGMTAKYNNQSPKLAGQPKDYLLRQLRYFKTGQRFIPEMAGVMQVYSNQELDIIAGYFAKQNARKNIAYTPARDTLKRSLTDNQQWIEHGEKLYIDGDSNRGIMACQLCHGAQGKSQLSALPNVNGQYARYIRATLTAYQNSTRKTDASFGKPMQQISQRLNQYDINAVAAYLQDLP